MWPQYVVVDDILFVASGNLMIFSWSYYCNIIPFYKSPTDYNITMHITESIEQGFQSGQVPGTFTRLRSCIVPAEITDPPPP
jgi:hypothetical protein